MKKIFINESVLYLAGKRVAKKHPHIFSAINSADISGFTNRRNLLALIEKIEQGKEAKTFMIINDSKKELEKTFFSLYKPFPAAGGAIFNVQNELLMIFRKGKWDLPKGKVDEGESLKAAAKREIMEETGITKLKIESAITFLKGKQECTYHTYFLGSERILKSTHWFRMKSRDGEALIPQTTEGIEKVEWCPIENVKEHLLLSYRSIVDVVKEVMGEEVEL